MEDHYAGLLRPIRDRLEEEVLENTPKRAAKAWRYLIHGYDQSPRDVVGDAVFESAHDGLVMIADIEFHSLCQHHLLPFFGKATVGYVPDGKVLGLSKIPRIVDVFARRLQLQEQMTDQIARAVEEISGAKGVAVMVRGKHMCSMMRGVEKQMMSMRTTKYLGVLNEDGPLRAEFVRAAE